MSPEIKIMCVANVYTRLMHFVHAGDVEEPHTHRFDHASLVSSGSVEVTVNGETSIYVAPAMIMIKALEEHTLRALEDNTVVSCIHALRDGDAVGDIIDPKSLPAGVSAESVSFPLTYV